MWSAVASALFAALVALAFRFAWDPPAMFYLYNVPIALPFAAFWLERGTTYRSQRRFALCLDIVVVALALARVFVPPFPFVSGHALFATYALLTASTHSLRWTAAFALAATLVLKLAVWGDWRTAAAGMAVAALFASARRRRPGRARMRTPSM
jgi:hypothetical protein